MDKLLSSARVWGPGFITPTYDESGRNAANFRAQLYGIGKIVKRLSLIARLAALWLLPSLNQRPNQGSSRLPDCRHSSFNWVRIPYTLTYLSKHGILCFCLYATRFHMPRTRFSCKLSVIGPFDWVPLCKAPQGTPFTFRSECRYHVRISLPISWLRPSPASSW